MAGRGHRVSEALDNVLLCLCLYGSPPSTGVSHLFDVGQTNNSTIVIKRHLCFDLCFVPFMLRSLSLLLLCATEHCARTCVEVIVRLIHFNE